MFRFFSMLIAALPLLLLISPPVLGQGPDALIVPKQHAGKWGYCTLDGHWAIPPMYDDAFPFCTVHGEDPEVIFRIGDRISGPHSVVFHRPLALVVKDGLYGLINAKGEEVVPFVSEAPFVFGALGGEFIGILKFPLEVIDDESPRYTGMAILSAHGALLTPFQYDCPFDGWTWHELPSGWLAMEKDGPAFPDFMPDLRWLRVRQQEGKPAYINENGAYAIPPQHDYLSNFWKGIAVACTSDPEDGRWRCYFIDTLNRQVDTLAGQPLGDFQDGCIKVSVRGAAYHTVMVNHWGTHVTPPRGEMLGYRKGVAIAMPANADDTYDVYDTSGQVVFQFHGVDGFYAHKHTVLMKDRHGYWSRFAQGKVVPLHQQAERVGRPLEFGGRYLFPVLHEGKWGLWDEAGHLRHPCVWDAEPQWLEQPDDGMPKDFLLVVQQGGKQGLVDTAMQMLLPCEYEQIQKWGGFVHVRRDGKKGLLKENYEWLQPPVYEEIEPYIHQPKPLNGTLWAAHFDGDSWGVFDQDGACIVRPAYHEIEYLEKEQLLRVRRHQRYGLLNLEGKELLPAVFDKITPVEGPVVEVWKEGKKAYFVVGFGLLD